MTRVIVSVTDEQLAALDDVVSHLRDAGMAVEDVQELLGTVTGSVEPAALAALQDVPGVADVELQRDVRPS
ncbi:hypothetical protein [Prauserella cavernicola]|uniref:Ketohydroxyglutarate aldolase n=1 Tax=Prauserella cavernicola TaxID=2800127 RepID=A0A934QMD5_9PSEU|nr:hypothetical protein [Prauserella cavernicola]MBK1782915.1 hypothetical protein [Prauserella cavernicola]